MVAPVRLERLLDQLSEIRAAPLRIEQQAVRARQRREAPDESVAVFLDRAAVVRLHGESLDDRQSVLHPMVQLTREQLALPLTPLALGEVDHAEQDQLRAIERPRVEDHRAPSDPFELVLDLEDP